ncbi:MULTISPECIES: IS607 family transposase [unclassified Streptosporangium]|uniref:IS607 family transposase n=1 Tax=unclassified Streptosporangium TaxID=2632669 RepID=UPI002E29A38E|nr:MULTISPECIES: IS607 family transposase [unclassified Streptosporangium]
MKLAEWARSQGIHPQTAYRWFREGKMPVPARRLPTGTIIVDGPATEISGGAALYARVSSHDQRADLDRQIARLTSFATDAGLSVTASVTEIGSGLNGRRPKLLRLLADASTPVIVVEHRDRLARFGVEYLEAALSAQGRRLIVADPGETTDDLVRDMIEVLTSMCARLYGRRGARNRALRALTATKASDGETS